MGVKLISECLLRWEDLRSTAIARLWSFCLVVNVGYAGSSYPKPIKKRFDANCLGWGSDVQIYFQTYTTSLPNFVRCGLSYDIVVCRRRPEPEREPLPPRPHNEPPSKDGSALCEDDARRFDAPAAFAHCESFDPDTLKNLKTQCERRRGSQHAAYTHSWW